MKLITILISCLFFSLLNAQENLVFSPINTSNGLSDNRLLKIGQLNDGRMVFLTEGLVNIYDGTEFTYIHYDERKAYSLNNYFAFYRIYIDSNNRLWIKNYFKLFLFDLNTESFEPNVDSIFTLYGIQDHVSDIFMDSRHNFWYLTDNDDLFYHKVKENKTYLFASEISKIPGNGDQLFDIAVNDSMLFLFFKSGQMTCFSIKSGKKLYSDNPFIGRENNDTANLIVVPYKQYLYQLRNGYGHTSSVVRYDITKRKWDYIHESTWQNSIFVDKKGNCWLGSSNGLWVTDESLQHVKTIEKLHLIGGKTVKSEIFGQIIDNEGGLWVGTFNKGLFYYHPDQFKFQDIRLSFCVPDKINRSVNCLAEFDGILLVGTQKGLFRHKKKTQTCNPFPGIPEDVQCNTLYKDSKERIWLCTSYNGLYCISKKGIKHYDLSVYCQHIYESETGVFYLSTYNGFGIFNPSTGTFDKVESSSKLGWIYELMDFGDNKLLGVAYGYAGLFVYDYQKGIITFPDDDENWMLRNSNLKCHDLFTDHRGLLWFGTQDGLNVYNPLNNTKNSFFEVDGLINNNVRSIIEDNFGRIWVSTANGISRISVKEEKNNGFKYSFTNFNKYDGVTENEFLPRSVIKTSDNKLIWGSLNGFDEINPNKIVSSQQQLPKPLITKLLLFGNEIKVGEKYNGNVILNKSISSTSQIDLKHFQNLLGFEFSALNYINPTQTYYKYKLEGVDAEWNETGTKNGLGYINYTNIPPGTYKFIVYAADNTRKWGDKSAEMTVVIHPPIWKTQLAYFIYIFLFLSALILVLNRYIRLNKRKIEKKHKDELENLKLAFYTNISHELRTPLTLIITPLDSILKKLKDGMLKKQLIGIYKNANDLLMLVNQLLDFRKLEIKGEKLQLSYCDIDQFLSELASTFEELANEKEIKFSYFVETENLYAYIDKNKIKKILNNLLSNALKYTPREGKVELVVKRILPENGFQTKILVQVSDTGCGISKNDLPHIFDRFYQCQQGNQSTGSGIGLHLVNEYIKIYNGSINVESQLGKGSTFKCEIPVDLKTKEENILNTIEKRKNFSVKILLIEDNVEFKTFLYNELSRTNQVITASNGVEGLEKARKEYPDLVISDIMMPKMSGIEFCYKLKNDIQISHIPVILLTARTSEDIQTEVFKVKADAYISKPFNMEILQLRIQNLIEQQENRKKLFKNAIVLNPETTTDIDSIFIKNIIENIEKNINNTSYSVKQLSNDVCMDRTGLYRKIITISGQSPSDFIRSVRLKKAAYLLKNGSPVYEVSENVGFGSTSYFIRCFKKEYGINPSSYKLIKQKN